ncbi:hypothetical protein WV31_18210 [Magnetospirillum sp. ME-1]|uniref:sensor histidine kinase n=1 Tax=Magnetospirillum sp. ME-1 TaxID=1639348 RepID=UPI000A17C082|nr:bacteriohemerythrin [Magnetospirillum sp. ME-1]ARJ67457.1 hypothetical protein WV31_18210 [Magnetospirillum sp. ME-1]
MSGIRIFPWDDNFNTGQTKIDEQHRHLVDLLNIVAGHIVFHTGDAEFSKVMDELADYTVYHFRVEEAIWHRAFGGTDLERRHQAEHQSFVTAIAVFRDRAASGAPGLLEELLSFLTRWLASHILEHDRHEAMVADGCRQGMSMEDALAHAERGMSGSTRVLIDIILSVYATLSSNAIELMREVAARKRANQELLHFTDVLAHHLQEPVRQQLLYCSMLKKECEDVALPPEASDALESVVTGGGRLRTLLHDMQIYLSLSSMPKPLGPCDVLASVRSVLRERHHDIREAGARVILDPLPRVLSHGFYLHQLLATLIDNALIHGQPKGPLEIRIGSRPGGSGQAVIFVEDNGKGVPADMRERVFRVFERLDAPRHEKGTGIGLAIARKSAELTNGSIWIETVEQGGTRVCFSLLIAPPEAAKPLASSTESKHPCQEEAHASLERELS